MPPTAKGQPTVNALVRGLRVLRCFDYGRRSLGSSEIARLTGLPQPTVWRLCRTLEREGYLVADTEGARFRPGLAVLTLGYAALGSLDIGELVRPELQAIADEFRGATGLTTREKLNTLILIRCEGRDAYLNVTLRPGSANPIAHSGTGWGYLAGLAPAAREVLLEEIRRRQPELWRRAERPYRKAMEEFDKTGYVMNIDTFFNGLSTIAVPVGGPDESRLYVVYCSVLTSVLNTDKLRRQLGQALLGVARKLAPVIEGERPAARPR
jgi:DNA-binding IclR family transcriptional regulator